MAFNCFAATATKCVEKNGRLFFRGARVVSETSAEDARRRAEEKARQAAENAAAGVRPLSERGKYPYPDRVLVEPVMERVTLDNGEVARVTRNSYGASVLNAHRVMFVDVDTEAADDATPGRIVPQERALGALVDLVARRPALAFRVYATRAGLRYLCMSRLFDPVSEESGQILESLLADKRYATLCRVQKCYRARLTPKPWRCSKLKPPAPTDAKRGFLARLFSPPPKREVAFEAYAACRFLQTVGNAAMTTPEVDAVWRLHDRLSGADSGRALA
jgi:hypothetical protein